MDLSEKRKLTDSLYSSSSPLDKIDTIQKDITTLNQQITQLESNHQTNLFEINPQIRINNQSKIKSKTESITLFFSKIKLDISNLSEYKPKNESLLKTQQPLLYKRLYSQLDNFHKIQKMAKKKLDDECFRQFKIVYPNVSSFDWETFKLNQSFMGDELLFKNHYSSLHSIQIRNNELLDLESSINELHDAFNEFDLLIQATTIKIDSIEKYIDNSNIEIEKGNLCLDDSVDKQLRVRSKRWFLCWVIVLVIMAGTGIVLLIVLPK